MVLKPDRTVRFDSVNHEPLIFAVLLTLRTSLCQKNMDPYEPRLNRTVLRTVNGSRGSFLFQPMLAKIKDSASMHFRFFSNLEQKNL